MEYPSHIIETARSTIFSQKGMLMGIRRTAWYLFELQMARTDPCTGQPYTPYKALENTLKWMAEQAEILDRVRHEPTVLQRRILQMLCDGKTQKEIAYEIHIDPRSIRRNLSKMQERIGADSPYQVLAIAVRKGWVRVRRTGYTNPRIPAIHHQRESEHG